MTVPGYAHPEALGHRMLDGLFDGPVEAKLMDSA